MVRALYDAGNKGPFLITTNTRTAASQIEAAAQQPDSPPIHHLYQPLDHPALVERFLAALDPRAAIFLVSDFWPNLITRSLQRGLPVIFASAQMSERKSAVPLAAPSASMWAQPLASPSAQTWGRGICRRWYCQHRGDRRGRCTSTSCAPARAGSRRSGTWYALHRCRSSCTGSARRA